MPFFPSMPDDAGPRTVFKRYPDIYRSWSDMSQALMKGDSPLSDGEREFILAFAAGVAGCVFVAGAHIEVAYALGIESGLVEQAIADLDSAPVSDKLRPLLAFVRKLALDPQGVVQADADAVFDAGWDEKALHDAIAITGRAAFMHRIVAGHGFIPLAKDEAARRAKERAELGYVKIFPEFNNGG
jgi:uncharacterized peroxidase-related enzyme